MRLSGQVVPTAVTVFPQLPSESGTPAYPSPG
jgi:hypothetical protein